MSDAHCDHCQVPEGLPCYNEPGMCRRAAQPGEDAFRAMLVRHARAKVGLPAMPSLARQAMNLAGSVVRHVAAGMPRATEAQRDARLKICRSNECGQFVGGRCALCGCYLSVRVGLANEACPHDPPMWGPVEPT
jgi:hypothetical protein